MAISVFKPGGGASDFEFPATDGTAGQALVTNGAGVLGFASMEQGFDFIQSTAPTITTDGQVWLKPTDGSHPGSTGIWLSRVITTDPFVAYWVTAHTKELYWNNANATVVYNLTGGAVFGQATTVNPSPYAPPFGYNDLLYLDSFTIRSFSSPATTLNSSNRFDLHEGLGGASGNYLLTVDAVTKINGTAQLGLGAKRTYAIGKTLTTSANNALALNCYVQNVVGSPAINGRLCWNYSVRGIHP